MDKSRQQFEEWFAPQKEEMKRNGLGMISITRMHQRQLSAWQASRESLEIELPEPNPEDSGSPNFYDGYNTAISDIHDELISNGVKIKDE
ncbi:hypothetical protein [Proteus mirabilis]|uniref:hypothetical protein n=1 Tax=Proteus mirabilis TaxID=584 RepID=UPI00073B6880|nr:hypothetical protein [Proteus mirabilis]KSX96010.1 hypothetical protein APT96_11770 [Proteus mirabilis]MBS3851517.1 hypothetical protein [Proteus mirabilis]MCI9768866.1 hypothetical protein [Proteus mirabilis]MCI9772456.1 hypothetical protein [Proteus mirabilis]MCI9776048.1 hypothetical protein [Proteus mirabilis]